MGPEALAALDGVAKPKINRVTAIKAFFEMPTQAYPDIRKIGVDELRQLSNDERTELGRMCAEQLHCEID
jgi:hypothetical protein